MKENLEEIKKTILKFGIRAVDQFQEEKIEALNASRTDNYLSLLSGYSAMLEERMGEIEMMEAKKWIEIRPLYKTNEETERNWKASDLGQEQILLARQLKAVDKIISACKQRLNRIKQEAYNTI